ncbi:hypothetical protein G7046_g9380 [Stylonectria norvegica]|nr:hypothetical protein G7046_g9380 [Stylonectria norvegica]
MNFPSLPRLKTLSRVSIPSASWLSRPAASGSRWKQRQGKDAYARDAKVQGLKSRAAFKLLEMDAKYRLFKPGGQTVVDLGYAPGSWSQVAMERTRPHGRVIGIDLIPAQPPRGVATFQGDFLSPAVQAMVKTFIVDSRARQLAAQQLDKAKKEEEEDEEEAKEQPQHEEEEDVDEDDESVDTEDIDRPSYIDMERLATPAKVKSSDAFAGRLVDVVLSDMSAPWDQISGFNVNSLSNPYRRLMNTSGNGFRDHAGSMVSLYRPPDSQLTSHGQDLCNAALYFASDTLKSGGHFVCKFYQGAEDKAFEMKLKQLFKKVSREKPESSRKVSAVNTQITIPAGNCGFE